MAGLRFDARGSDSPWIDTVWTCTSEQVTEMTSVAAVHWGLVFCMHRGTASVTITGPESKAGRAPVPEDATFVGIEFGLGTSLRTIPARAIVDGGVELPDVTHRAFRLGSERWETPGPDDAEALVARLVRSGELRRDPLVTEVAGGHRPNVSTRTVQRRFLAAVGLTQGAVRQIRRARTAAALLDGGRPAAEVVHRLGFFDEPHLARSLRRYVGRTATQLREGTGGAIALGVNQRTTS